MDLSHTKLHYQPVGGGGRTRWTQVYHHQAWKVYHGWMLWRRLLSCYTGRPAGLPGLRRDKDDTAPYCRQLCLPSSLPDQYASYYQSVSYRLDHVLVLSCTCPLAFSKLQTKIYWTFCWLLIKM